MSNVSRSSHAFEPFRPGANSTRTPAEMSVFRFPLVPSLAQRCAYVSPVIRSSTVVSVGLDSRSFSRLWSAPTAVANSSGASS